MLKQLSPEVEASIAALNKMGMNIIYIGDDILQLTSFIPEIDSITKQTISNKVEGKNITKLLHQTTQTSVEKMLQDVLNTKIGTLPKMGIRYSPHFAWKIYEST